MTVEARDAQTGNVADSTTTDAGGAYALSLEPGSYDIAFIPPSQSNLLPSMVTDHLVIADQQLDVVLLEEFEPPPPPPPTATVSGVARDAAGVPLAGWTVYLDLGTWTTTGSDGSYSVTGPTGNRSLILSPNPGPLNVASLAPAVLAPLALESDRTVDLTWPTVAVEVTVLDTEGNPVPDASVSLSAGNPSPLGGGVSSFTTGPLFAGSGPATALQGSVTGATDANGVAHLVTLSSTSHTATISAEPPPGSNVLGGSTSGIDISTDATATVSLTERPPPPPTATVSGVARDAAGVPLAGWTVYLDLGTWTTTGSDGSYSVTGPTGNRSLILSPNPGPLNVASLAPAVLAPLALESDRTVDLTWPTVAVEVTVLDTEGNPVPDASVSLSAGNPSPLGGGVSSFTTGPLFAGSGPATALQGSVTGATDANGVAHLVTLSSTSHTATISAEPPPGSNVLGRTVAGVAISGDRALTVFVASLAGTLRDGSGQALAGQVIELEPSTPGGDVVPDPVAQRAFVAAGAGAGDETATDGSYGLTVSPGVYDLHIRNGIPVPGIPGTYTATVEDLDLTTGRVANLTLPTLDITVTVRNGDGAPVAGAEVSLPCAPTTFTLFETRIATGTVCDTATTNASGVAVLDALPTSVSTTLHIEPSSGTGLTATTAQLGPMTASTSLSVTLRAPVVEGGVGVVVEGDDGTVSLRIPVRLSSPSAETVTVDWTTAELSEPAPGLDYDEASGVITFLPGVTEQWIDITVHGDTVDEPGVLYGAEWLLVALSAPTNAIFGSGFFATAAHGFIFDDD